MPQPRSVAWFTLITFVPLWAVSQGDSQAEGNRLLSLMLLSGAVGTLLLGPIALAGLGWAITQGQAAFPGATLDLQGLLVLTGPLTAVPLLLFAAGARRIPLSLLGMLQYIGPTIQLALGVWLFHEPFAGARAQGFAIIWAACALFSAELWWRSRRTT